MGAGDLTHKLINTWDGKKCVPNISVDADGEPSSWGLVWAELGARKYNEETLFGKLQKKGV